VPQKPLETFELKMYQEKSFFSFGVFSFLLVVFTEYRFFGSDSIGFRVDILFFAA